MKPLTIRASVTAWFIGLTMALIGAFAVTLVTSLGHALRDGVDATLKARAEAMAGVCAWEDEISDVEFKLSADLAAVAGAERDGRALEVWTWPGRRLLHRSGDPIPVPAADPARDDGSTEAVEFADLADAPRPAALHLATAHVPALPAEDDDPDRPAFDVLVRTADGTAAVDAQLARMRWILLVLIGASSLVVLAFAAFLSRRFVARLRELGGAAAAVRAGGRTAMPRRGNGDEVDRLAEVLDVAFASLEDARDRQARFTANAAHELRNPITILRNAAEVALRHERSPDEYRRFLGDVLATSERTARILEALLLLARLDAERFHARFSDVDLLAVVRQSAANLAGPTGRIEVVNGVAATVRARGGAAARARRQPARERAALRGRRRCARRDGAGGGRARERRGRPRGAARARPRSRHPRSVEGAGLRAFLPRRRGRARSRRRGARAVDRRRRGAAARRRVPHRGRGARDADHRALPQE